MKYRIIGSIIALSILVFLWFAVREPEAEATVQPHPETEAPQEHFNIKIN